MSDAELSPAYLRSVWRRVDTGATYTRDGRTFRIDDDAIAEFLVLVVLQRLVEVVTPRDAWSPSDRAAYAAAVAAVDRAWSAPAWSAKLATQLSAHVERVLKLGLRHTPDVQRAFGETPSAAAPDYHLAYVKRWEKEMGDPGYYDFAKEKVNAFITTGAFQCGIANAHMTRDNLLPPQRTVDFLAGPDGPGWKRFICTWPTGYGKTMGMLIVMCHAITKRRPIVILSASPTITKTLLKDSKHHRAFLVEAFGCDVHAHLPTPSRPSATIKIYDVRYRTVTKGDASLDIVPWNKNPGQLERELHTACVIVDEARNLLHPGNDLLDGTNLQMWRVQANGAKIFEMVRDCASPWVWMFDATVYEESGWPKYLALCKREARRDTSDVADAARGCVIAAVAHFDGKMFSKTRPKSRIPHLDDETKAAQQLVARTVLTHGAADLAGAHGADDGLADALGELTIGTSEKGDAVDSSLVVVPIPAATMDKAVHERSQLTYKTPKLRERWQNAIFWPYDQMYGQNFALNREKFQRDHVKPLLARVAKSPDDAAVRDACFVQLLRVVPLLGACADSVLRSYAEHATDDVPWRQVVVLSQMEGSAHMELVLSAVCGIRYPAIDFGAFKRGYVLYGSSASTPRVDKDKIVGRTTDADEFYVRVNSGLLCGVDAVATLEAADHGGKPKVLAMKIGAAKAARSRVAIHPDRPFATAIPGDRKVRVLLRHDDAASGEFDVPGSGHYEAGARVRVPTKAGYVVLQNPPLANHATTIVCETKQGIDIKMVNRNLIFYGTPAEDGSEKDAYSEAIQSVRGNRLCANDEGQTLEIQTFIPQRCAPNEESRLCTLIANRWEAQRKAQKGSVAKDRAYAINADLLLPSTADAVSSDAVPTVETDDPMVPHALFFAVDDVALLRSFVDELQATCDALSTQCDDDENSLVCIDGVPRMEMSPCAGLDEAAQSTLALLHTLDVPKVHALLDDKRVNRVVDTLLDAQIMQIDYARDTGVLSKAASKGFGMQHAKRVIFFPSNAMMTKLRDDARHVRDAVRNVGFDDEAHVTMLSVACVCALWCVHYSPYSKFQIRRAAARRDTKEQTFAKYMFDGLASWMPKVCAFVAVYVFDEGFRHRREKIVEIARRNGGDHDPWKTYEETAAFMRDEASSKLYEWATSPVHALVPFVTARLVAYLTTTTVR